MSKAARVVGATPVRKGGRILMQSLLMNTHAQKRSMRDSAPLPSKSDANRPALRFPLGGFDASQRKVLSVPVISARAPLRGTSAEAASAHPIFSSLGLAGE